MDPPQGQATMSDAGITSLISARGAFISDTQLAGGTTGSLAAVAGLEG
jgi:hypothetical protein